MEKEIEEIKVRLECIESKLDLLLLRLDDNLLNNLSNNCNKMGEHIDFVDSVYETLKKPLEFVSSKVNYISSNNEVKKLPDKTTK